ACKIAYKMDEFDFDMNTGVIKEAKRQLTKDVVHKRCMSVIEKNIHHPHHNENINNQIEINDD
ncbi:unnamed protein product, partial [Didymodactylos carnosus]